MQPQYVARSAYAPDEFEALESQGGVLRRDTYLFLPRSAMVLTGRTQVANTSQLRQSGPPGPVRFETNNRRNLCRKRSSSSLSLALSALLPRVAAKRKNSSSSNRSPFRSSRRLPANTNKFDAGSAFWPVLFPRGACAKYEVPVC